MAQLSTFIAISILKPCKYSESWYLPLTISIGLFHRLNTLLPRLHCMQVTTLQDSWCCFDKLQRKHQSQCLSSLANCASSGKVHVLTSNNIACFRVTRLPGIKLRSWWGFSVILVCMNWFRGPYQGWFQFVSDYIYILAQRRQMWLAVITYTGGCPSC